MAIFCSLQERVPSTSSLTNTLETGSLNTEPTTTRPSSFDSTWSGTGQIPSLCGVIMDENIDDDIDLDVDEGNLFLNPEALKINFISINWKERKDLFAKFSATNAVSKSTDRKGEDEKKKEASLLKNINGFVVSPTPPLTRPLKHSLRSALRQKARKYVSRIMRTFKTSSR
ncbi:hypothetical protein BT69DRAFT_1290465 [Atractiella rhizophila]|nr:hypothetical protein BT69DRAFT_1290465 [Atractiella rhizophila]